MADDSMMTLPFDKLRDCPVQKTMAVMGGKWKTRILWHLRQGPCRFGELQRTIDVSVKVLTQNLRALERDGLISRTELKAGNAIATEYEYTAFGRSLVPALDAMGEWGMTHGSARRVSAAG